MIDVGAVGLTLLFSRLPIARLRLQAKAIFQMVDYYINRSKQQNGEGDTANQQPSVVPKVAPFFFLKSRDMAANTHLRLLHRLSVEPLCGREACRQW